MSLFPSYSMPAFLLCCCLFSFAARGNSTGPQPISLQHDSTMFVLPKAQVWVDTNCQLSSWEAITAKDFSASALPAHLRANDAYWLYFKIENPSEKDQYYWLQAGVSDSLTLLSEVEGQLAIQHRGLLIDYSPHQRRIFRGLKQNKYGFIIHLPPQATVAYYLRLRNLVRFETDPSRIQIGSIDQQQQFMAHQAIYFTGFQAFFFGAILFLLIFSLSQYGQIRDHSYLFYAAYLLFCAAFFWWKFEKSNAIFNVVFTNFPEVYYHFEAPMIALMYLFYFLFVANLLNAREELPGFYRLLRVAGPILAAYFGFVVLITLFLGLPLGWELIYWIRIPLIPMGLAAIYLVFKARHRLGFYILSGTLIMLCGGAATTFLSKSLDHHYYGPWDIPLLPIQVGILLETFFFSAGLGYKSRLAEQEKIQMLSKLEKGRQEAASLRRRKEMLSRSYANISHESRTPLTVILGAMQQIKGHQRERELIQRNGQQLLSMINQVLDINQIEANKMQVHYEQLDVMQLVRYLAEPFELLAEGKAQSFHLLCTPGHLLMDVDRSKFQKILNNLVSNAVKFTPPKGRIRVDAFCSRQAGQDFLIVEVSDSGPGIPADFQQLIFDPYVQLPDTTGGTGLGLTITRELTLLMDGAISLKSDTGRGSTFTLQFPVRREAPLAAEPLLPGAAIKHAAPGTQPAISKLDPKQPSILIVEDHPDILEYLQSILNQEYNVFMAPDGDRGFEMALQIRPDLILSDIMMPGKNGNELCLSLKQHPLTCDIPFILLTAKASRQDRLEGIRRNADAYLTKPFDEEELLLQIKRLIRKKQEQHYGPITAAAAEELDREALAFLQHLHEIIDRHLNDESFKTEQLGANLNMNHVSLNKKIKALTGQTTGQYLRSYRLETARELLCKTSLTVAEISYKIGVGEPANFNKMFKKAYGITPQRWRTQKMED